jgi:uncharacterized protein (TIGR01777 family)
MTRTEELLARSQIPAPASEVFAWHGRPGALERLSPPWEHVTVEERTGTIHDGDRTVLRLKIGPASQRWVAVHRDYQEGRQFADEQVQGPFASWLHTHVVESRGASLALLEDRIRYTLPLGGLGRRVAGGAVRQRLARMFGYRHATLAADLQRHRAVGAGKKLRVAVSGASGFVGTQLCAFLTTGGHTVSRIVRHWPAASDDEILWDPARGEIDAAKLEGFDAVVHLAGENVGGGRWTRARKERILKSRVEGTRLLAETLAKLARPPSVFVSGSAIGLYGQHGDEPLDENTPPGNDFLAEVCRGWEAAAEPAVNHGIRVVHPRFGVILSPSGGALAKLLPPMKVGAGGRIGSGKQITSWVSLDDAIYAVHHALCDEALVGPMNVVAPHAVSNAELTHLIGEVLHRPTVFPLPATVVKLLFGEMGETMLLGGARVVPARLQAARFAFQHPTLPVALAHLLGRRESPPPLVIGGRCELSF